MKMGNNRLPIVEMVLFDVFNPTKDLQGEALLISNIFVKGRVRLTNQMNFGENSKQPLTPPSLLENYIAIYYNGYGCIYARRYEGQIVRNTCT